MLYDNGTGKSGYHLEDEGKKYIPSYHEHFEEGPEEEDLYAKVEVLYNEDFEKEEILEKETFIEAAAVSSDTNAFKVFLSEIKGIGVLKAEEERDYLIRYLKHNDLEAKDILIKHNIRLVISLAKRYHHTKMEEKGIELSDLVSEGIVGLMKAIDKFDLSKETKLSTYATLWISQKIIRFCSDQGRTIRVPTHMVDKYYRLQKEKSLYIAKYGKDPTEEELSALSDLSVKQIRNIYDALRISETSSLSQDVYSNGEEKNNLYARTNIESVLRDEGKTVESIVEEKEISTIVQSCISDCLNEKEYQVICFRYGLNGGNPLKLEEIGNIFDLSRERIRQIEVSAKRKLEKNPVLRDLFSSMK